MPKYSAMWREKVSKMADPRFAITATTLKPEHVDTNLVGHHFSMGFKPGTRTYAFEGQVNRDRFVNRYRPHGASPCKNPCP